MKLKFAGLAVVVLWACQPSQQEQAQTPPGPAPGTPEWKIQNAVSAAPEAIAKGATIMDWPATEGGQMTQLRAGTNEWACFPDNPQTGEAVDPMCLDKVWQTWADAWMNKKPFSTKVAGLGYMLQGGGYAHEMDPYKMAPDPGEPMVTDPPHLMWISPNPAALASLPTTRQSGGPWVMWKGTPYAHVMIPVK